MIRFIMVVLLGCALLVIGAAYLDLIPDVARPAVSPPPPVTAVQPAQAPVLDLGEALYTPLPSPPIPTPTQTTSRDPIILPAHMAVIDKVEISSQVSGQLLFIGEEVPEGSDQVAGIAPFLTKSLKYARIKMADQDLIKFYHPWIEGDIVRKDQMLAFIDPAKAMGEVASRATKQIVAELEVKTATAKFGEASARLDRSIRAKDPAEDRGIAELTKLSAQLDVNSKQEAVKVAKTEKDAALIVLHAHEIHNPSQRAMIKTINRWGGEAVKEFEPIMQLVSLDRLRAEGQLEEQFLSRLRLGMPVMVEPSQDEAPWRVFKGHRREITCVALTQQDPQNPLIVSGSEDDSVCVWNRNVATAPVREFYHPDAVRSLAVSPAAAGHNLIASGCSNGMIYLWDLAQESNKPLKQIQAHGDAVTAIAFSPDGTLFASGGADSAIKLWRTDTGEIVYAFDAEHGVTNPHQGIITALHFTPQSTLVSASRDNSLRVWSLKKRGAQLAYDPIQGRSATVGSLGVSADGRYMFFDRSKDLQLLSVADGRRINSMHNQAGATFETLAQFSPDASLVMTAGASEGRLQLWSTPTATSRAFEIRQMVTVERAPVTCAVFSPLAGKGGDASFAVSGTKDNLYLWPIPSLEEAAKHRIENVNITSIDPAVDPSTRQVRIGIEIPNSPTEQYPNGRLIPGQPVTVIIE